MIKLTLQNDEDNSCFVVESSYDESLVETSMKLLHCALLTATYCNSTIVENFRDYAENNKCFDCERHNKLNENNLVDN